MDAKTQQDMQIEMSYCKNQGHWWLWVRILIHDSEEKTYQWLLANNERVQATVDQCATSQMKYSGP